MKLPALPSLLLALSSLSSAALAQPAITLQQRSVTVEGITAKGQVVWFSMAREVSEDDVATLVRRAEAQTDGEGDGRVVWDIDREGPLRSIWVAVDVATGRRSEERRVG